MTGVQTSDGEFRADLVVLGLGVRPASKLAADAGIEVGQDRWDRRPIRAWRRASDGIWAAGDCVEVFHRVSRRPVGDRARDPRQQAGTRRRCERDRWIVDVPGSRRHRGDEAVRVRGRPHRPHRTRGPRRGLRRRSPPRSSRRPGPGYYPGAAPITVKVVAEAGTGRLLGAQVIGREGAAKRIDVLAVAIWNEMTAADFSQLDLGYAPPFSPVWDPALDRRAAGGGQGLGLTVPDIRYLLWDFGDTLVDERFLWTGPPEAPAWRECYRDVVAGELGSRWNCGTARFDDLAAQMATRLGMAPAAVIAARAGVLCRHRLLRGTCGPRRAPVRSRRRW